MLEAIKDFNLRMNNNLDKINQDSAHKFFEFNTNQLIQYYGKGTEKSCPVWQELGWRFKEIEGPVVYWFQFSNSTDPGIVFNAALRCKESQDESNENFRHLPAIKSQCANTNTLYVGACASTKFINRMFWHFGYYSVGKTQGLQLCHWSRELDLQMNLNVIQFPAEARELIYIYEKIVATNLNPIIGK